MTRIIKKMTLLILVSLIFVVTVNAAKLNYTSGADGLEDGYLRKSVSVALPWADLVSTTDSGDVIATTANPNLHYNENTGTAYTISRNYIAFNTSFNPALVGKTITGITMYIKVTSITNEDNDGDDFLVLVNSTYGPTIEITDFKEITDYEITERVDISGMSIGWVALPFTQAGINAFQLNGLNTYVFREGHDLLSTAPGSGLKNEVDWFSDDTTVSKPYLEVTYTDTPIELTFVDPTEANNSIRPSSSYVVNVTYTTSIPDTGLLNWNGTNYTMTCASYSCNYSLSGLSNAYYYYNTWLNDTTGNSNISETRYITIDTTYPQLSFVSPTQANDTFRNTNSYLINISYSSSTRTGTMLNWNGANQTMTCGANSCNYTVSGLADGTYTYKVYMNQTNTNANETEVRLIKIDATTPVPSIIRPEAITYATNTSLPLNWSVTEDNLGTVWYNVDNGDNITLTSNITFNVTAGAHTLNIYANDSAANEGTASVSFQATVNDNPVVNLDYPSNGTTLNTNSVVFNSTASDTDLATCELWGDFSGAFIKNQTITAPKNYTTMNWTVVTLDDGTYHWNVWCNDSANNAVTALANFTVYIDATYPQIHAPLNSPSTLYNNYTLLLNITATDANIRSVWLETNATGTWFNHTMANISDNYFVYIESGNFTNQLNLTYRFHVNDSAGNVNLTTFYYLFVENRLPPTPTIVTINGTASRVNSAVLNVTAVDPDGDVVTYYYRLANGSGIGFGAGAITYSDIDDGLFNWFALAGDGYGNSSNTENQSYYVDTLWPSYFITEPTEGASLPTKTVSLTYNVTDNLGYTNCWYNLFTSAGDMEIENTTLANCDTTRRTINFVTLTNDNYYMNFYVNDTANNVNSTVINFQTGVVSTGDTGGGGPPPTTEGYGNVTTPSVPICGNNVCESTEDLINCPIDCPLNFDTLSDTLRQAWFARAAFFFIIGLVIYMAYVDTAQGKKVQKNITRFLKPKK